MTSSTCKQCSMTSCVSQFDLFLSDECLLLHRIDEFNEADGHQLGPNEIFEYLSQVMYARRSKFNPLWNSLLIGGYKDGKRFATSDTELIAIDTYISFQFFGLC